MKCKGERGKMSKIDFYNELQEKIEESVSIKDVFALYDGIVFNKNTSIPCPFCGSSKSFSLYGNKCKCFKCTTSHNVFSYYKDRFGVDFFTAKISLARDFNLIDSQRADEILSKRGKTYVSVTKNNNFMERSKQLNKINDCKSAKRQSDEVINNVYTAMSRVSLLTEHQYKHLLNVRAVPIERIARDYFRMPRTTVVKVRNEFMIALLKDIKKHYGYTAKDLVGVPGFYIDEKTGNVDMVKSRGGIAIKSRAANGMVNGVQIRKYDHINDNYEMVADKEDGDSSKYYWFSSKDRNYGVSSGACVDVSFPPGNKSRRCLYITEGKFKAEAICRSRKAPVIALPGVELWRGALEPQIAYIQYKGIELKDINICFDSDIGINLRVYNAFKGMSDEILNKYKDMKVNVLVWEQSFGKGLDDVINSNNINNVKSVPVDEYLKSYEVFLELLNNKYDIDKKEVFYKGTKNKVDKDELFSIYKDVVLKKLNVILNED